MRTSAAYHPVQRTVEADGAHRNPSGLADVQTEPSATSLPVVPDHSETVGGTAHACDACGGTGYTYTRGRCPTPAAKVAVPCETCHGSGRISDVMPVSDALADAETLWAFVRDPYAPHILLRTFGGYEVDPSSLRCHVSSDLWARGHFYETERALVDDAVWSAHAAFRAVPGLRGE